MGKFVNVYQPVDRDTQYKEGEPDTQLYMEGYSSSTKGMNILGPHSQEFKSPSHYSF